MSTRPATFPSYFAHRDARCFQCLSTDLRALHVSGHAPGHGAFRGECPTCRVTTWYDCAEGTVELIQLCEHRDAQPTPLPKAGQS